MPNLEHGRPDLGDHYTAITSLGRGQFGDVYLAVGNADNGRPTAGQRVAVKLIGRGEAVSRASDGRQRVPGARGRPSMVEREVSCTPMNPARHDSKIINNHLVQIINHRRVSGHPNIITFYEVFLTRTHLGIAMEAAEGGELFSAVKFMQRFQEHEARHCFQQLISAVASCHSKKVCHRDLKLENSLLTENISLKICDFGYSKCDENDSNPKTAVGTPAYVAPEVIHAMSNPSQYNGEPADVWSCGVMLYTMLVGAYPFHDPNNPNDNTRAIQNIQECRYTFPQEPQLSAEAKDLIERIFKLNPAERITLAGIQAHPWFRHDLPAYLADGGLAAAAAAPAPLQTEEEIRAIIQLATEPHRPEQRRFNEFEFFSSGDSMLRNINVSCE